MLCPAQAASGVRVRYRVTSIQTIRTSRVRFASAEGAMDPRGPTLLELKEQRTPRVGSCFS
jgi:hypothetical protein